MAVCVVCVVVSSWQRVVTHSQPVVRSMQVDMLKCLESLANVIYSRFDNSIDMHTQVVGNTHEGRVGIRGRGSSRRWQI